MSAPNHQFPLALEALLELNTENTAPQSTPTPAIPSLSGVLAEIGPLPREALFLGVAPDGLPVLLNLHDPIPGPMLIVADAGAGKTAFLQNIARFANQAGDPKSLLYCVITNQPEEWEDIEDSPHRVGIFSSGHASAQDLLMSLALWAHGSKSGRHPILLLIDDLEAVVKLDFDALQNLRWLLLRGPSRRVWPIITLNAERYGQVISWIPSFRTRIFGRVKNQRVAAALGANQASALDQLEPRIQFSLRENENWLQFWLPSC